MVAQISSFTIQCRAIAALMLFEIHPKMRLKVTLQKANRVFFVIFQSFSLDKESNIFFKVALRSVALQEDVSHGVYSLPKGQERFVW